MGGGDLFSLWDTINSFHHINLYNHICILIVLVPEMLHVLKKNKQHCISMEILTTCILYISLLHSAGTIAAFSNTHDIWRQGKNVPDAFFFYFFFYYTALWYWEPIILKDIGCAPWAYFVDKFFDIWHVLAWLKRI